MDWYGEYIAGMLESHSVTGRINFRLGAMRIQHSDYATVAKLIRQQSNGKGVSVTRGAGKKPGTRGSYNFKKNVLWFSADIDRPRLPAGPNTRLHETSTWVHEATHVIQDLKDWKLTVGQAEMMAHIAQALFIIRFSERELFNNKLVAAGVIAKKLLQGDSATRVTSEDLASLVTALRKVKSYDEKWNKVFDMSKDSDGG